MDCTFVRNVRGVRISLDTSSSLGSAAGGGAEALDLLNISSANEDRSHLGAKGLRSPSWNQEKRLHHSSNVRHRRLTLPFELKSSAVVTAAELLRSIELLLSSPPLRSWKSDCVLSQMPRRSSG